MGIGAISMKYQWLNDASLDGLVNLLVRIAMPALLIHSILSLEIENAVLYEFVFMVLISFGGYFLFGALATAYTTVRKLPSKYKHMVQVSMLSSNNGFMGFPITVAFFGEHGLLYMLANNLVMNMVLFSYGVHKIQLGKEEKEDGTSPPSFGTTVLVFLKRMLNPNIVAIFIGLAIGIFGLLDYVPEAIMRLLASVGNMATPLSMIYIGASLYGSHFVQLLRDRLVLEASLVRLLLLPLVLIGLLLLLPLPSLVEQIMILYGTLPTATVVSVLASEYGNERDKAPKIVLVSTLLSLGITPLGVWLALTFF